MRLFFLLITSLLIFSCTQSTEISIPTREVSKTDQRLVFYKNGTVSFNDSLFSGTVISYFRDSLIQNSTSYYKGIQEGNTIGFHPNGDTSFIRTYHFGKKHGTHRAWHQNGKLKFEYHFKNGYNIGNHKEWYKTGQAYTNKNYIRGKEQGLQRVWRLDGKLRANYVVKENGRKYGVTGMKRCKNLNTKLETMNPILPQKDSLNTIQ